MRRDFEGCGISRCGEISRKYGKSKCMGRSSLHKFILCMSTFHTSCIIVVQVGDPTLAGALSTVHHFNTSFVGVTDMIILGLWFH